MLLLHLSYSMYVCPNDDIIITVKWLKRALTRPWIPNQQYNPTEINVQTLINRVKFTLTQKLTKFIASHAI